MTDNAKVPRTLKISPFLKWVIPFLLATSMAAHAEYSFLEAAQFHRYCEHDRLSSIAFVRGVLETMVILKLAGRVLPQHCNPKDIIAADLTGVACQSAKQLVEEGNGNRPAVGNVMVVLQTRFPCK